MEAQPARKPSSYEEEKEREEGGQGNPEFWLQVHGITGDMTQGPFLILLGPHVLFAVNSVHNQPFFFSWRFLSSTEP